jgi:hypothetical protein
MERAWRIVKKTTPIPATRNGWACQILPEVFGNRKGLAALCIRIIPLWHIRHVFPAVHGLPTVQYMLLLTYINGCHSIR